MRIVLLTRFFPPEISGGARRPHGLVAGWRADGHHVTVVAPAGADDPHLIAVPHPTYPARPSHGTGQHEASGIASWLRTHLMLPDPEVRWALRSVRAAEAAAREADWIVSTSPPESLHLAARLLSDRTGTPWLADMRDLWLERPQLTARRGWLRQRVERPLARWILGRARALTAVSPALMHELDGLAPDGVPRAVVGHFTLPYAGPAEPLPADSFNIVHTGAISLSNPLSEFACLLEDFEKLVQRRPDARLWLAGHLSAHEVAAFRSSPAGSRIEIVGPVDARRARALQAGADALALVSGRNSHALPGKQAEYRSTGLPILVSAPGPWLELVEDRARLLAFADAADLPKATPAQTTPAQASPAQATPPDDSARVAARQFIALMNAAQPANGSRNT